MHSASRRSRRRLSDHRDLARSGRAGRAGRFGAGYSSLGQVRDLSLDKIKIDRSFVERVCLDPKIASLTRAIVDMARRLDLPCVAEGIESPEQLDELRLGGCAEGQGWLFAPAMPEAMVARFIEERSRAV